MLNKFRDYLTKQANSEDLGQRAEVLITLGLGVLSTLLPVLAYKNPITLIALLVANIVGFFTLYQAFRSRYKYLPLFPIVTSFSVCIVTIAEGKGTHDLFWMANLGLFLLVNIYSKRSLRLPISLAIIMIGTFIATGIAEIYGPLKNEYGTTLQYIYLNSFFFATMMAAIIAIFQRHYSLMQIAADGQTAQIKSNLELQEVNQTLENRIESRTRELSQAGQQLQERAVRLQTISEISQEISSNVDLQLQELLNLICQVISKKLSFYHVGIFLLDENHEYAVLRAANSEGGKRMLERRHQLRVGGTGIVGYAAQSGRPRIALDTGSDAVFFNNPDLPKTHSEIAIPLKYGLQIIGVLDMQSIMSSAFNEEDTNLLSTLANQIAITINNVIINERLGLKPSYHGRTTRHDGQKQTGYSFNADGTISTAIIKSDPILEKALASGEPAIQERTSKDNPSVMAIPVRFRDNVIGIIHIEATEENRKWTEDEITVVQSISDRAAIALENARLFEETSRRAEQEETIARITSQIGSSTDFNRILQTTIEELGRTLGTARTFIQLETPAKDGKSEQQSVTD